MNTWRLTEIVPPLLRWYDGHARILPWRENPEPYAVWISEIMLQQTRVEAVKPYFDRWMKAFPDLSALAAASEAEVLKLWEGLGYYSRVRNILRAARLAMDKHGGSLPSTFEGLRGLPGVGEYTAGAVGSIAFRLPVPCVDGNVLRVLARLTASKADIGAAATKKQMTEKVREIIPLDRPGDFNQAMMELGATVCLPNGAPKCEVCPVAHLCEACKQGRVSEFPVKSGKPPRRIEKKTVLVLLESTGAEVEVPSGPALDSSEAVKASDGSTALATPADNSAVSPAPGTGFRTALRKRPVTGLLAGLWEFPNYDGELTEEEVRQILKASGLRLTDSGLKSASLTKLKNNKHIFTHIEWEMTGYLAVVEHEQAPEDQAPGFIWVGIDQLEEQLTLPAAFKSYYQILKRL
jgi:A/G-specific adenine glycosylase